MNGAWLAMLSVGCSSAPTVAVNLEQAKNLDAIQAAYFQASKDLGRPPQGPEDLNPYLTQHGGPAAITVSPRDNKPYVIVWGVDLAHPQSSGTLPPVLAYEQAGAQGKRYISTMVGLMALTDAEFATANLAK